MTWRIINDAAFANLDAWVPAMGLPRLKRAGGDYRAVASFRPSRAGLPDAKRPRALTISPRGICDHADSNTGYSPIDLVAETFGISPAEAKDWLAARLGGVATPEYAAPVRPAVVESGRSSAKLAAMGRLWDSCIPLPGTPAERYLHGRGLSYNGDAIRFRPAGCTMAVAITDAETGALVGVQQTHLKRDGTPKRRPDGTRLKLTAGYGAGVVRLSADEDVTYGLAVAEGVETALAAPFRPIWACLTANNLSAFPVLAGVECLTIFADNDASGTGQKVAFACAERWHAAGKEVEIRMLAEVGRDYADLREAA